MRTLSLAILVVSAGCATSYAYTFHLAAPAAQRVGELNVAEDADVRAELLVDPTGVEAIVLDLTNKTDQPLQVRWSQISLSHADGTTTSLQPDQDLGWIAPRARRTAQLSPFALPRAGSAAASYQGQTFELTVPVIVRRELKLYHYRLTATVRKVVAS